MADHLMMMTMMVVAVAVAVVVVVDAHHLCNSSQKLKFKLNG